MAEMLFFVLFFGAIAWFAYNAIRHGGFKGAMFGGAIVSTTGEVATARRRLVSNKLRVHVLASDRGEEPAIGLELSSSAPGSWGMTPVRLSLADARQLAAFLEQAVAQSSLSPARS